MTAPRVVGDLCGRHIDPFLERLEVLRVRGVEGILAKGDILVEAKEKLRHGDWGKLCRRLPFGQRHALNLRAIAKHPALANRKYISVLPERVATLCLLARLDAHVVEAAIASGCVSPRMTVAEVRRLAGSASETDAHWSYKAATGKISAIVAAAPGSERSYLAPFLRSLARDIEGYNDSPGSCPGRAIVLKVITAGVRALAKAHHPDRGGSTEKMAQVNLAAAWLRRQAPKADAK